MKFTALVLMLVLGFSAAISSRIAPSRNSSGSVLKSALLQEDYCAEYCPLEWVNDGSCDLDCYVEECNFDGEDCRAKPGKKFCADACSLRWVGDGICDFYCNVEECQFDKGDCDQEEYI